ncbi:MAG TPA: hypothetical protein VGL06_24955 [Pseudonocardiaceae bacterium]
MDFRQTITALGRRWYVAIPVFFLVVGMIGVIAVSAKHQYESTGTVVLREPSLAQSGGKGGDPPNPMLSFSDSLSTDAQLLVQSLNSPTAAAAVGALGGTATFVAGNGAQAGPFIIVTADSLTAGPAAATVALAFKYASQELAQREKALGASISSYIILDAVVPPTDPTLKIGGKSRLALAALIISLAATLTATSLADAYLRRRAGRRVVPAV